MGLTICRPILDFMFRDVEPLAHTNAKYHFRVMDDSLSQGGNNGLGYDYVSHSVDGPEFGIDDLMTEGREISAEVNVRKNGILRDGRRRRRICICLITDFYYPYLGGVELHIHTLALQLITKGFKVIVITHAHHPDRYGIRYMSGGIKVYYLPLIPLIFEQVIFPNPLDFVLFRKIFIRDKVDLVHGHQTTSASALIAFQYAKIFGIKTLFTDHSIFCFERPGSVHLNGLIRMSLSALDGGICVSNCLKVNLVLRSALHPKFFSVIPNPLTSHKFCPNLSKRPPPPRINIIVMSRLVYRKGASLLADLIPVACVMNPNIHFIIGGDGPKRIILEEVREKYGLESRVTLLGSVHHSEVPNVLQMGHIFLNTSLSETFCMAIIEAAACGMLVVATRVGGVPEVLPAHIMKLAECDVSSLVEKLKEAVDELHTADPLGFHKSVNEYYSIKKFTQRTIHVYQRMLNKFTTRGFWVSRKHQSSGPAHGIVAALIYTYWNWVARFIDWIEPRSEIDDTIELPREFVLSMRSVEGQF